MTSERKKLLFLQRDLVVGGIPLASISLFNELNRYFNLDLWLTRKYGELKEKLPPEVHSSILPQLKKRDILQNLIRHKNFADAIKAFFVLTFSGNKVRQTEFLVKALGKSIAEINQYDCVIAYHGKDLTSLLIALQAAPNIKKIAWIHGCFPVKHVDWKTLEQIYMQFDKIYCVSENTREHFLQRVPACQSITDVFLNLMDVNKIVELSNVPLTTPFSPDKLHLVTVGRVSEEKGQLMIPHIIQRLASDGLNFVWHIVGDGASMGNLKDLIHSLDLSSYIVLHGNQINPFPYMKYCDLYVQPSYTEGYCLTLREAAILGCTIIATKVGGVAENLDTYPNATLVSPTVEALHQQIKSQLSLLKAHKTEGNAVSSTDYSNKQEIHKLIDFI